MRPAARSRLLLWVLVAVSSTAAAQPATRIHLAVESRTQLEALSLLVSIEQVRHLEVWGYASPQQLEGLERAGFAWEEVSPPSPPPEPRMGLWTRALDGSWDAYPTYPEYVALMEGLAAQHADICRLHDIGDSTNTTRPHELLVMKISDHPDLQEDEPEVFYTSTMHGDEVVGYVLLLRLVDELLSNYTPSPSTPHEEEIRQLVDELEIWINPLANPDGTYFSGDETVSGAIRYYATTSGGNSFVDPNRNFPDPDEEPHPDGQEWWAETLAMIDFAADHSFVLSANFHGGAEVVNYPWDTWERRHVDDGLLIAIARAYATQAQDDGPPEYMTDLDDGITNGWDWYPIAGGRQDFMTYWMGSREMTIELSSDDQPDASLLPEYWSSNRQALLDYSRNALQGVRGVVTDPGGAPLAAGVEVVGHDIAADNSYALTDPDVGDYHRMLLPGTYTLRFAADGYRSQTVDGVAVGAFEATRVDVVLEPVPLFADGFESGDLSAWSHSEP